MAKRKRKPALTPEAAQRREQQRELRELEKRLDTLGDEGAAELAELSRRLRALYKRIDTETTRIARRGAILRGRLS